MIKNNNDFFAAIEVLQKKLTDKGFNELANQLKDAAGCSTLPGEIFGEIKIVLNKIKNSQAYSKVKKEVDESLECIAKIWP